MTHRNCIRLVAVPILLAATPLQAQDEPMIDPTKDKPIANSIGMELKLLPAATWVMGSESGLARDDENPAHKITLTKPFYIGVHEVTQEQYENVMGKNPSHFKGPNHPVESLRWESAVTFCEKLSELPGEKAAGRTYRLPTEAEWEYACRAGTTTEYSFGDDESQLGEYAWSRGNGNQATHPVGQKKPNPWGLYDMHGNVWERCHDWYAAYHPDHMIDPNGPSSGSHRVRRGGSWELTARHCRSSYRGRSLPKDRYYELGFRVVAIPSSK